MRLPEGPLPPHFAAVYHENQGRQNWRDEDMAVWTTITWKGPNNQSIPIAGYVRKEYMTADSERRSSDPVPSWWQDPTYFSKKNPRPATRPVARPVNR